MKIWYDACTGKHLRYGSAIATRLRSMGQEVTLTTRRHPDTLPIADFLNEKVIPIGLYNPESLLTRLREGIQRQLTFCKIFGKDKPNIAISHGSVDQCRVAFGLGTPIISTVDTPYAEAVQRLTLPLSDYIIASKAIPRKVLQIYNVKGELVSFDGVDEAAWIKDFKPKIRYDFERPLIVIRELEEKAAYKGKRVSFLEIANRLTSLGKVVFLSRYVHKKTKNLIVPKEFIDSASLVAQADLFIGAGGTITREAAMQGTPAIIVKVFPHQHVNDFLIRKGFPIFKAEPSDLPELAEKLLGKRFSVMRLLDKLENPVDTVVDVVTRIGEDRWSSPRKT